VFAIDRGRDALVADPTVAVVMAAGEAYRFSHPADGGDACVVIAPRADVLEEALGSQRHRHGRLRPATQLAVRALTARLAHAHGTLAAEDDALTALGAVADDLAARPALRAGPAARRRVRAAQELLAADPGAAWRLEDVARAVHSSPFHLARQFRAVTGASLGRHLTSLRLSLALDRLAGGETQLARLAVDVGFAHHSHFSAAFRARYGEPPSHVRTILTARAARAAHDRRHDHDADPQRARAPRR
jgi:AraC family transcriptional regulator